MTDALICISLRPGKAGLGHQKTKSPEGNIVRSQGLSGHHFQKFGTPGNSWQLSLQERTEFVRADEDRVVPEGEVDIPWLYVQYVLRYCLTSGFGGNHNSKINLQEKE